MASRKNRDVKFIIYQSLYIFVIAVLALKGAKLDLTQVVSKDNVEEKQYTDSLKLMIDSLLARGIIPELKFDTAQRFTNPEELKRKLVEAQQELIQIKMSNPSLTVNQTSPNVQVQPEIEKEKTPEQKKEDLQEEQIEEKQEVELRIPQSFTQYTSNTVSNPGNTPIEIFGDGSMLTSIPPGGSRTFQLGGQSSLTFKRGSQSKTVSTKENSKPKILTQRLVPAGEEVSLRSIQSTVGYRVTITDDFPGQLDVKFSGPVTVKQAGPLVYDVTLNFLQSKASFDSYTDNKEAPYSITFQISVKDKIATQHSVNQSGVFQFGEW